MTLSAERYRHLLWGMVVFGAVLRFWGLNWDDGRGLHPDEGNLIRAALTLGVQGRFLPEFHAYNDLALWLPRLVSWPFCDAESAACLTLTARALSAAMAVAVILPGAYVAQTIAGARGDAQTGRLAGLAAAGVLATSGALVQWAHFGTTESAIALLVVALWAVSLRWMTKGMTNRALALGAGAMLGVGFGFKTTAIAVALIPMVALALGPGSVALRLRLAVLFGAVALVQGLAFAPSVLFATGEWLDVMQFENGVVDGSLRVFWTAQFEGARNVVFELRQIWSLTSGAGMMLAVLALALMPRAGWRLAAPGLAFALVYAALTFGWHAKFVRYLAPLLPVVLVLAGVAVGVLASGRLGRAARAAGLAGAGLMALAGVDGAMAYLRPDPRIAIETALGALAQPDERVAVEPRDLPQIGGRAGITLPLDQPQVNAEALAAPLAEAGWLVIASRRNWEVLPRQPGAAPVICAFYSGLADGSLGFVPVRRAERLGPLGRLFAPGLGAEETRTVFDRPEVILFRNIDRLPAGALAQRLATPRDAASCAPGRLQDAWRRGA